MSQTESCWTPDSSDRISLVIVLLIQELADEDSCDNSSVRLVDDQLFFSLISEPRLPLQVLGTNTGVGQLILVKSIVSV